MKSKVISRISIFHLAVLSCLLSLMASTKAVALNPSLSDVPFSFVENKGQFEKSVKFAARKGSSAAWLKADGWSAAFREGGKNGRTAVVSMQPVGGAKAVKIIPEQQLSHVYNYLIGDRSKWVSEAPAFAQVRMAEVYPGIDVELKGEENQLRYDIALKPGADLSKVSIAYKGVQSLEIDPTGRLIAHTAIGEISQRKPITYALLPQGGRRSVDCQYVLLDKTHVGFKAPGWSGKDALVVDPVLAYSRYIGGSGYEAVNDMTKGPSGEIIIVGSTTSTASTIGITPGVYKSTLGAQDGLIVKFSSDSNSSLSTPLAITYAGGTGPSDEILTAKIDSLGNIYFAANFGSGGITIPAGQFDTSNNGFKDIFLGKLNPQMSTMLKSTWLGGNNDDIPSAIDIDPSGNILVVGTTKSSNFPTTAGVYDTTANGDFDGFIAKLNGNLASLLYGTYIGGSGPDVLTGAALLPGSANVLALVGNVSTGFPTTSSGYDTTFNGGVDVFVGKFDLSSSTPLVYGSYFGGSGGDIPNGNIVFDANQNLYVAGYTSDPGTLPTTSGVFRRFGTAQEGFLAKFNLATSGSAGLIFSTLVGGSGNDFVRNVALGSSGAIYLAGSTASTDFPTTPDAFASTSSGGLGDGFLMKISPDASSIVYSTLFGGAAQENVQAMLLTANRVIIAGISDSVNLPVLGSSTSNGGLDDLFIAAFDPNSAAPGAVPVYSLQGRVVDGQAQALAGATISDGAGHTTTTNSGGYFNLNALPAGTLNLTVNASACYVPLSISVNLTGSQTYQVMSSPIVVSQHSTVSVLGRVVLAGTQTGLGGVSITDITNGINVNTTSNGQWSATTLCSSVVTVSATKAGYTFSPNPAAPATAGSGTLSIPNFQATALPASFSLSGQITLNGSGLSNVALAVTGSASANVLSVASGGYTVSGLGNGTYTITPTLAGYTFMPASLNVSINGANATGQNFAASQNMYSINGSVMAAGNPLAGATIDGGALGTQTTDGLGNFVFANVPYGATFSLVPAMPGYMLTPNSANGTITSNATIPFTATALPVAPPVANFARLTLQYDGVASGDRAGRAVAILDVDGDGLSDLAVSAPGSGDFGNDRGRVDFFRGTSTGISTTIYRSIFGTVDGQQLGIAMAAVMDINGNGKQDIAIVSGANGSAHTVKVYDAYLSNTSPLYTFTGQAGEAFGGGDAAADEYTQGIASADLNADNKGDIIVGARLAGAGAGRIVAYSGSNGSIIAAFSKTGSSGSEFGTSIASGCDLNGDGHADVVVGAPKWRNANNVIVGRVYGYNGTNGAQLFAIDGPVSGSPTGFGYAVSCANAKVVVGSPDEDASATLVAAGAVRIYDVANSGAVTLFRILTGDSSGDHFGKLVANNVDFNNDSFSDLAVSIPGFDGLANNSGVVRIYQGPEYLPVKSLGYNLPAGSLAGSSIAVGGDFDGDGYRDIAFGSPRAVPSGQTCSGNPCTDVGESRALIWSQPHDYVETFSNLQGSSNQPDSPNTQVDPGSQVNAGYFASPYGYHCANMDANQPRVADIVRYSADVRIACPSCASDAVVFAFSGNTSNSYGLFGVSARNAPGQPAYYEIRVYYLNPAGSGFIYLPSALLAKSTNDWARMAIRYNKNGRVDILGANDVVLSSVVVPTAVRSYFQPIAWQRFCVNDIGQVTNIARFDSNPDPYHSDTPIPQGMVFFANVQGRAIGGILKPPGFGWSAGKMYVNSTDVSQVIGDWGAYAGVTVASAVEQSSDEFLFKSNIGGIPAVPSTRVTFGLTATDTTIPNGLMSESMVATVTCDAQAFCQ